MTNILVVTGSIRPNSVNEKVIPHVTKQLKDKGANVIVADLKELDLPFFDSPLATSNPDFSPTDERVQRWTDMVAEADGVVLVTPEYNHTMTPVQLNAIDWIGKEWQGKPVGLVGYGWTTGGGQAHDAAREALAATLKARVAETQANLYFSKHISPTGEILDEAEVQSLISAALDELLEMAKEEDLVATN